MLLEESEILLAKIVSKLASNGVQKTMISAKTFFDNPNKENIQLFEDSLDWLSNEGVIRIDIAIGDDTKFDLLHHNTVLTAYGFARLGDTFISSEDENRKVGEAIKSVSENGGSYANAGQLIGGLLGAFTKSISN